MMHVVGRSRFDLAGLVASLLVAGALAAPVGCGQDQRTVPPSLDGPSAIAMASRADCGSAVPALSKFHNGDDSCRIGLVANAGSNRLALVDLGRRRPFMIDMARSVPSINHIAVGQHPIDVAAARDGTAAYTLNSVGNDVSIVDLWNLTTLDRTITVPGTPKKLVSAPGDTDAGQIVVATTDPGTLWFHPGIHCDRPEGDGGGCSGFDAEASQLELPGSPSDLATSVRGRRLYVVYRDRNYMSVVALAGDPGLEEGSIQCRGHRTSGPCEVRRVGLTYGCSDGVDNDGDGRIDQRDPQCWGPDGAESPDGIGRAPPTACNDGEDNDGDGRIDRADPECQSAADDSESEVLSEEASFACSNGSDDDDDGDVDYPADPSCYGPKGRRESALETTGFHAVAPGKMGTFLYVVDRANSQVLIVDAADLELIDAPAAAEPSATPFNRRLGIPVGNRPAAVKGFVARNVIWRDPQDDSHGIVRHSYGAYVASDNGNLYHVQAARSECEVEEPNRDQLLRNRQFDFQDEAFQNSAEKHCLRVPAFPLDRTDDEGMPLEACAAVEECETCLQDNPVGECESVCQNRIQNRHECRAAGRELQPTGNVRIAANPIFGIPDNREPDGRIQGRGRCDAPEIFTEEMRTYTTEESDAPENFSCDSPLRSQPLTPLATEEELQQSTFESLSPAHLLRRTLLRLQPVSEGASEVQTTIATETYDYRFRNEQWTITWEGVVPNTRREDGLLDNEEAGRLDVGGLDLCSSGVREGDRLTIRSKPKSGEDAPDSCSAFTRQDSSNSGGGGSDSDEPPRHDDPFLTFEVASVRPHELQLRTLDDENRYAQQLPTRKCFPTGLNYEIRAADDWVVQGEQSGFNSERTSELGRCVPRFSDDVQRLGGRVSTGSIHQGPYLEFLLYEGPVPAIRRSDTEYTYQFGVRRFFNGDSFRTDTILPSDVFLTPFVNGGAKVLVSDASADFVYVRNLSDRGVNAVKFR